MLVGTLDQLKFSQGLRPEGLINYQQQPGPLQLIFLDLDGLALHI